MLIYRQSCVSLLVLLLVLFCFSAVGVVGGAVGVVRGAVGVVGGVMGVVGGYGE